MASVVLVTGICLTAFLLWAGAQSQEPSDNEVELAIKQLWSADNTERLKGKAELSRLGGKAIPGIISLLQDLTKKPGFRYVPGKEPEPLAAKKHYDDLLVKEKRGKSH